MSVQKMSANQALAKTKLSYQLVTSWYVSLKLIFSLFECNPVCTNNTD